MSESQTPMVDAAEFAYCDDLTDLVVESSLARELETELTVTRARLAELEGIADRLAEAVQMNRVHGSRMVPPCLRAYEAYRDGK